MPAIPTLTTERLVLRPFGPDDADAVERLAGERAVADTTLNIPHPYPPGAGAEWIASLGPGWEEGTRLTLAIAARESPRELRGAVGLGIKPAHRYAELGYWIALPHWNRGYATEASRALVGYGFDALGLHRVQARHFVRNPASGRVMVKLGMRREGVLRESLRRRDRFEDVVLYAVLDREWRAPGGAGGAGAA